MRLWRARRRHCHIDATITASGETWHVAYYRDDRPLMFREFGRESDARADAATRLKDLQRAGWVVHW
jgi:hypothetical protein